jgi:Type IIA topoisomerase (DNA gyrase/topo II, topoisomerase IV), A subunit
VKDPSLADEKLVGFVPGPDLPTGGILVETAENIAEAYATGRGGFRVRARWEKEDLGRGTYQIIITEIPYQVQKSRLIEQLADIVTGKKNHALGDVRDESAEDIRIVLEPRNRSIEPDALMEILFRDTELESRISLNLNVLDAEGHPRVHSLKDALLGFVAHRRQVVLRRTSHRLGRIADRLEILEGLRLVYLDLDEVIRIIREEDEPKLSLIERFRLTDRQAEAILDTRLRSLRKLEEEKMVAEIAKLEAERTD